MLSLQGRQEGEASCPGPRRMLRSPSSPLGLAPQPGRVGASLGPGSLPARDWGQPAGPRTVLFGVWLRFCPSTHRDTLQRVGLPLVEHVTVSSVPHKTSRVRATQMPCTRSGRVARPVGSQTPTPPPPMLCLYNFHLSQSDMITLDDPVIFSKLPGTCLY